jgi:RNAse (barnase) inhibitor barstar
LSNSHDKYQSRSNRARVRELFLQEWDPIGVQGCEGAEDEYDTYVNKAYVMLMDENANKEAIAAYLNYIATDYMGLSASDQLFKSADRTAEILLSLRPQFETQEFKPKMIQPNALEILIDCSAISSEEDFHKALAKTLSFPAYYGNNLDALWDVLAYVKRPVILILGNSEILKIALGERYDQFINIFSAAKKRDIDEGLKSTFDFRLD